MENEESTLAMVMNKVAQQGYNKEFKLSGDKMVLGDDGKEYSSEDLEITKSYRFEGDSNPDDMSVLYLIHTNDGKKGILVDAFGAYGNRSIGDFLKNVKIDKKAEETEN